MRKRLAVAAGIVVLLLCSGVIVARERLLAEGRVLFLELAPVDPRSLMQGDYMALRFRAADELRQLHPREDGHVVLQLDARGVGRVLRLDQGTPLAAGELRLRYRLHQGQPRFATHAYFFQEGRAQHYAGARYGEFRVNRRGQAILAGLRGPELAPLAPAR